MSNPKHRKLNIDADKFKSLVESITNKECTKMPALPQEEIQTPVATPHVETSSEKTVMSESYKKRMKLLAGITK